MYIFNSFYLLHSYNLSFLICSFVCVLTWSLLGVKKVWASPRSVSFRGLIQNIRRASPPLSYAESPPLPWGFYRTLTSLICVDLIGTRIILFSEAF